MLEQPPDAHSLDASPEICVNIAQQTNCWCCFSIIYRLILANNEQFIAAFAQEAKQPVIKLCKQPIYELFYYSYLTKYLFGIHCSLWLTPQRIAATPKDKTLRNSWNPILGASATLQQQQRPWVHCTVLLFHCWSTYWLLHHHQLITQDTILWLPFSPLTKKSTISVSAVLWLCAFVIMGKVHGEEVSSVQSLLFPTNSHKWMPAMDGSIYVWNIVMFNTVWVSFWPRSLLPWDLPCHKKSSLIVCLGHQAAKILSSLVTPYSRSLLHTRHGCWWMCKRRPARWALDSLGNYSSHNVTMVSSIARCTTMHTPPGVRAFKTSLRPISSWTKKVT